MRRHCSHREQPRACVLHAPRREPHRCEMRIAPCAPPHHTLPCRAPIKVRAVCTDHEHAAEAALLLAMATVDDRWDGWIYDR